MKMHRIEELLGVESRRRRLKFWRERFGQANIVGPTYGADGTSGPATGRQGKAGDTIVAQAHGKYYEASSRGVLAFACDQGAGVATTTGISTTAILSLYNPLGSKVRLSIKKVSLAYFSGTLGAGPIYHCVNPVVSGTANPTAPTGGTPLTSYWTDIMNPQLASAPQGIARTGSTVVAPIVYRPLVSVFAELASTANGMQVVVDDLDGEITLEPGGIYQIQSVCATGTSPKVTPGIVWEEVPFAASLG